MKLKIEILFLLWTFSNRVQAQIQRPAKEGGRVVVSVGNSANVGSVSYQWTVGDVFVFTGEQAQGFFTQGFEQPMVCKSIPVISAFNQTSCLLPYTLKATPGFDIYYWKLGKSIIASDVDSVYFPVSNGNYLVWVGDSTGCYIPSASLNIDYNAKNSIPSVSAFGQAGQDTLLESTASSTYQWYVITPSDGIHRAIVDATGQTFRPYYNGIYYVKTNTDEECTSYSSYYQVNNNLYEDISRFNFYSTDSTIDLKKRSIIEQQKLSVYPVPSRNKVTVDYHSSYKNNVSFNFYNMSGVLVDSKIIKNTSGKISYEFKNEALPAGKYIVEAIDGSKLSTQNIVFE